MDQAEVKEVIIAVDFDGTCVTHEYPRVGRDIGAEAVLRRLIEEGHRIILWTMRSGNELQDAVGWFEKQGVPLFGINANPEQSTWSDSPKAYAQLYIDDAALGVPLCPGVNAMERPFVDWGAVGKMLFGEA